MEARAATNGTVRMGEYLRKLRTGYGYSLRRVQERVRAEGGEIDNSQLCRYEKGLCYPSFDRVRLLASVFNVSIQSFADVLDLDSFERHTGDESDASELIEDGRRLMRQGEPGEAFVRFERALELLDAGSPEQQRDALIGDVRVHLARSLIRLGKFALAETELRAALRNGNRLAPEIRVRALLGLAHIHAAAGERFFAEIEAQGARRLALQKGMHRYAAMALQITARILADRGKHEKAIERFHDASRLFGTCGDHAGTVHARIGIANCYIEMGRYPAGTRLVLTSLARARKAGWHCLQALAWSTLGRAHYCKNNMARSAACLRKSDTLASRSDTPQPDLLFLNAYYVWQMSLQNDSPTRQQLVLGRLKTLRSCVVGRSPETDAFDEHVTGG